MGWGWGWVAGLTKNKANSAQLGLAGAWAELGKNETTTTKIAAITTTKQNNFVVIVNSLNFLHQFHVFQIQ